MDNHTHMLVILIEECNIKYIERIIRQGANVNEAFLNLETIDLPVIQVLYENGLDVENETIIDHLSMIGTRDAFNWWNTHRTRLNFGKQLCAMKHNLELS